MTKKMEKIINTYEGNLNTQKWLYEKGYLNFDELQDRVMEECNELEQLISGMYHFHLLSVRDFKEATLIPFRKRKEIIDSVLEI